MAKRPKRPCVHPGCTDAGVIRIEEGEFLCGVHVMELIHRPDLMALTEADAEMADFRSEGGRLS